MEPTGLGGGLALFWHQSLNVSLHKIHEHFIHVIIVKEDNHAGPWRATFVYGEPRTENRPEMWKLLRRLRGLSDLPWIVIGDFNEAMWCFEHFAFTPRPETQMQNFRHVLSDCHHTDIGFVGLPYTYDNRREGDANVKVCLDRATADTAWRAMFDESTLCHIVSPKSDHCPILLQVSKEDHCLRQRRPFRYECMRGRDPGLADIIKNAREHASHMNDLNDVGQALHGLSQVLKRWSHDSFGSVRKELQDLRQKLEGIQCIGGQAGEIKRIRNRMDELLYREELMWLQCSHIAWLKGGTVTRDISTNNRFGMQRKYYRQQGRKCLLNPLPRPCLHIA